MIRKIIIIAIILTFVFFRHSYSQTTQQILSLKSGFNFIAFTVKPSQTPTELISQNPSIQNIYSYSASSGSFLSVSEGTLLTLNVGKGYIIKASSDIMLQITGVEVPTIGNILLKPGFNLVGFSKVSEAVKFTQLMSRSSLIIGMYKWSASSGSFITVLGGGNIVDGIDPTVTFTQAYFISVSSDTYINYDSMPIIFGGGNTTTQLTGLIINDGQTLKATFGDSIDLSKIKITATYLDTTAKDITSLAIWTLKTGGGSLAGNIYTASDLVGTTTIEIEFTASYSEAGISRTADIKIYVTPKFDNTLKGEIKGNVYDFVTGFPIRSSLFTTAGPIEVNVNVPGSGILSSQVSSTNGDFLVSNIPAGTYTMTIKHAVTTGAKMFNDVSKSVNVIAGQTTDLGIIYVSLATVTIKGRIKDKVVSDYKAKNPTSTISDYYVSGTQVQASINGTTYSRTTTTAYDGSYQLDIPVYSDYTFKVISTNYDYAESSTEVTFPAVGNSYITQVITATPKTGKASGTVYLDSNDNTYFDASDSTKIKDAYANNIGVFTLSTNYRGVPITTTVNSDSTFRLDLPIGEYYIIIEPPLTNLDQTYAGLNKTLIKDSFGNAMVYIRADESTNINAVIVKSSTLNKIIYGRVMDSQTLAPIQGANVKLASETRATDNFGYFVFTNQSYTGDYLIMASKNSYQTLIKNFDTTNALDIRMNKGIGSISGRVINSQNISLANVRVIAKEISVPNDITTTSNDMGNFLFDKNLFTGTYDLNFTKLDVNGQVDPNYSVDKLTGVSVNDGIITRIADMVLDEAYGSINGTIYFDNNDIAGFQNGQDIPLSDIQVSANAIINGSPVMAKTNSLTDGKFSLTNLKFGTYTLVFEPLTGTSSAFKGYNALPITIKVNSMPPTSQYVRMKSSTGDLYGIVFDDANGNGIKDEGEQPISGIALIPSTSFGTSFIPSSTTVAPFTTSSTGQYEFDYLNPIYSYITIRNSTNIKNYQQKIIYLEVISGKPNKFDIPLR